MKGRAMFCPKCKGEFVEGIKECPGCIVQLVKELPAETEPVYVELITVLETGDVGIIMIAKSLLEENSIRYYAKGEVSQHLFGGGNFGTGFNPLTGPVQLQVGKDNSEEALLLLKDLLE
jgi:hypothetical protein